MIGIVIILFKIYRILKIANIGYCENVNLRFLSTAASNFKNKNKVGLNLENIKFCKDLISS